MKIRTNINLDDTVKKQLKAKAKELGTSVSRVIERVVRKHLNRLKN